MKKELILSFFLLSNLSMANDCIKTKAAFDIGSGTTKLKVAKVDTCLQKIVKVLLEDAEPVPYKQSLKESADNRLSKKIVIQGINALRLLKNKAKLYNPIEYTAVATSAFRTSQNGESAVRILSSNTDIKIKTITQKQEAMIGFAAASAISDKDIKDLVVWDIGGGSMQITSYLGNGKYDIYEGKLASVSFKNHIIQEVQSKDPKTITTPNPISKEHERISTRDARLHSKWTFPKTIRQKLLSKDTQVIGIGGVHYHSVAKKVSPETKIYTLDSLSKYISSKLGLNNKQLGDGKYVSTDVSNLILVKGFMQDLKINKVKTGKINLADGVLVLPSL